MFCGKPLASGLRRCESCEAQAVRPDPRICPVCEQLRADCRCRRPFQGLAAPFYYEMGADKAIQDLKFHGNLLNARKLGDDLAELLVHPGLPDEFCYGAALVPVPLHPRDRRRRGYNQAEEIARQISRRTGIPLRPEALKKCRRTAKQHELSAAQRKTNLQGPIRPVSGDWRGRFFCWLTMCSPPEAPWTSAPRRCSRPAPARSTA